MGWNLHNPRVAEVGLVHDGEELPRLSCRFATADEPECTFEAGPAGLAVLALQFPVAARG